MKYHDVQGLWPLTGAKTKNSQTWVRGSMMLINACTASTYMDFYHPGMCCDSENIKNSSKLSQAQRVLGLFLTTSRHDMGNMQMFRNASISVCPAVSGNEVLYLWDVKGKILQPMRVFRPSNVRCSVAIRMILGWLHFRRPCCFPLLICYEATSIWILSHSIIDISTFWGLGEGHSLVSCGFRELESSLIEASRMWPNAMPASVCTMRPPISHLARRLRRFTQHLWPFWISRCKIM